MSFEIVDEFSAVLDYEEIKQKMKNKKLEMKRTTEKIISTSRIVEPKQNISIIKEDPEDNKILECAFEGKVDYIVSQDNHILKLRQFRGIKILTPEEFIKLINQA